MYSPWAQKHVISTGAARITKFLNNKFSAKEELPLLNKSRSEHTHPLIKNAMNILVTLWFSFPLRGVARRTAGNLLN